MDERKDYRKEESDRRKRDYSSSSDSDERSKKRKKEKKDKKHKKSKKQKKEKKQISANIPHRLSEYDDYSKNADFKHWVKTKQKDLNPQEAKTLWVSFVKYWNRGDLDEYYQTKNSPISIPSLPTEKLSNLPEVGPARPEEETLDIDEQRELERYLAKKDMKAYKKNKDVIEEELVPKKTGREAMLEKKKQKSAYTRKENDTTESFELKDKDIFGGSDDISKRIESFKDRESRRKLQKLEERERIAEEYRRREEERLAPFKALLASGQIPLMQQPKRD